MKEKFVLTKDSHSESQKLQGDQQITVTLDVLKKCNFFIKGYKLPEEIYPHLEGSAKEAWDCGWRGGIIHWG